MRGAPGVMLLPETMTLIRSAPAAAYRSIRAGFPLGRQLASPETSSARLGGQRVGGSEDARTGDVTGGDGVPQLDHQAVTVTQVTHGLGSAPRRVRGEFAQH